MVLSRFTILAVVALPVVACAPSSAPSSVTPAAVPQPTAVSVRAAADAILPANVMRDAAYFASDPLMGRATVTRDFQPAPGFDSAAAYISRRLRDLRVKPGGDNGTYLRHYTLRRATLDTVRTRADVETQTMNTPQVQSGTRAALAYRADYIVRSFNGTGRFTGRVVYVGNGQRSTNGGIDPFAGLDVRGKWLLVNAQAPQPTGVARGDFVGIDEEARTRGAIGILTMEPMPATPTAAAVASGRASAPPTVRDISPTAGRAYAPYPLPRIALYPTAVARLMQNERVPVADLHTEAWRSKGFALSDAKHFVIEIAGRDESTIRPYNVVGIIEGTDPSLKAEYISVASHLDGAVGTGVINGDSIYNAADDNASGSAGNLAIAQALMSGPRPKRSVLLIWDSGEETGLWGSRAMAYSPTADSIVAHFNVDMIGRTDPAGTGATGDNALSGPGEVFVAGPRILSTHMDAVLDRVSRDYNYIAFDRQFEVGTNQFFYPRTDASPYFERGIPFVEFFTGIHGDYHRQTDEASKLDPVKMAAVSRAVYVTVWMLANDTTRPVIDRPIPSHLPFITPRIWKRVE